VINALRAELLKCAPCPGCGFLRLAFPLTVLIVLPCWLPQALRGHTFYYVST